MEESVRKEMQDAIWIAHTLFARGSVTGSTGNLSFRAGSKVYVSASGGSFGTLSQEDFSVLDMEGNLLEGRKASKEWPLHLAVYKKSPGIGAVIHTHSTYCVLWSCLDHENKRDIIPDHTPYLKMKLGTVGLVPYERPGSRELFDAFGEAVEASDGWILKRHGGVVPGKNMMDAFYCMEELEESARIAWELDLRQRLCGQFQK